MRQRRSEGTIGLAAARSNSGTLHPAGSSASSSCLAVPAGAVRPQPLQNARSQATEAGNECAASPVDAQAAAANLHAIVHQVVGQCTGIAQVALLRQSTSGAVGRSDELVQHFSCVPPHDTEARQEASSTAQCAFKRLASRSSGLGAVKGWCSASSRPSSSFHSNMGKSTTHSSECWPSCRQCEPAQKALALRSGARLRHRGKAVNYSSGQRCSQCMQNGRPTSRGRRPPTAGWAGPPALTGAEGREPKHMPCTVQPPHPRQYTALHTRLPSHGSAHLDEAQAAGQVLPHTVQRLVHAARLARRQ